MELITLELCLQGDTPLTVSSAAGREDIVRILIAAGADVDSSYIYKVGFCVLGVHSIF